MTRQLLTDDFVAGLAPAKPGTRYEVMDAIVPRFGVRVTDKGKRTFILVARFPGSNNPIRVKLGTFTPFDQRELATHDRLDSGSSSLLIEYMLETYGAVTCDLAREKARRWLSMLNDGIDPRLVAQQAHRRNLELNYERRRAASPHRIAYQKNRGLNERAVLRQVRKLLTQAGETL